MSTQPYGATVVADSISPCGVRLTTIEATFPRIILAEFNTHRVFSRNSASSRAIPVKKRIEAILTDPYIPEAFASNKRGMQAGEDLDEDANERARNIWIAARDEAAAHARQLDTLGVHKQWANRLLEPFAWHTVVVTATEWDNYWALRISDMAQPEIKKVSIAMKTAMDASSPTPLNVGGWHLPYVQEDELTGYLNGDTGSLSITELVQVSAARCARVSYLTQNGVRDVKEDIELYSRLTSAGHMSPHEHPAIVEARQLLPYNTKFVGNFRAPWVQHRKQLVGEAVFGTS